MASCQYSQYFFGHVQLENGTAQVTVNNLTAGARTTEPWRRPCEGGSGARAALYRSNAAVLAQAGVRAVQVESPDITYAVHDVTGPAALLCCPTRALRLYPQENCWTHPSSTLVLALGKTSFYLSSCSLSLSVPDKTCGLCHPEDAFPGSAYSCTGLLAQVLSRSARLLGCNSL